MTLTVTEQKAYDWLVMNGAKQITHKQFHSPDFETDIGMFEVKKIVTPPWIAITPKQVPMLQDKKLTFLVYIKDSETPVVCNSKELVERYQIYVNRPSKKQMGTKTVTKEWSLEDEIRFRELNRKRMHFYRDKNRQNKYSPRNTRKSI